MSRSFRIPPPLFFALILGACSGAARQCLIEPDAGASAGNAQNVPAGCEIVRAGKDGMAAIACDDGRQGYVFQTSSE